MFSTIDGCCIGYFRNPENNICESKLHYFNFEVLYQKSFKNDYDHEFFLISFFRQMYKLQLIKTFNYIVN